MARRLTQDEVIKNIYDAVGDEYTLLGEYKNSNTKIKMRHNKCCHPDGFYVWDITYHGFIDNGHRCPCESNQVKITTDDVNKRLHKDYPTLTVISKYTNSRTRMDIHCSKCNFIFKRSYDNLFGKTFLGCPVCNNVKISYAIKGYNDLWTTHPEVANLLKDKAWGYTHTYNTHEKTDFICPHCGKILNKLPSLIVNKNGKITCNYCSDGISYPEKFFMAMLMQLNVDDYIPQLNASDYRWINKYKYDFYLKHINCIVETHGLQHYENSIYGNVDKQIQIDIKKKKLALENGIDLYIELDCRYSNVDWIKNSILNSELSRIFDLSNIDWNECGKQANNSLMVEICRVYNNEKTLIPNLAKKFNLSDVSILKYLNKGNELGLCDFDAEKNKSYAHSEAWKTSTKLQEQKTPVYCHELGIIVESQNEAKRKYNAYNLRKVCGNPNRTSGGYHWSFIWQLSEDILSK